MMRKKVLFIGLSIMIGSFSCLPVYAYQTPSAKEEVVYIMADAGGVADEAYIVNIFSDKKITDYGEYKNVKVLNTTDSIQKKGDCIEISTDADKLYYQGTLEKIECPWNISVSYFLNGKKYSPKKLAGQSGELEIRLNISKNNDYTGDFYERFALQVGLSLDSEKCKNIIADGATIVNVGSEKQLSYIALPNQGLDVSIKSTVKDFEMSGISINGMKLNLNMDIDDDLLKEKMNELIGATTQINDGAKQLESGNRLLASGSRSLPDGALLLNDGANTLDQGVNSLENGMKQIQDGLTELNGKSEQLSGGSEMIQGYLEAIQEKLTALNVNQEQIELLKTSSTQFKQAISDLNNQITILKNSVSYDQYKSLMNQQGLNIDNLTSENKTTIKKLSDQINDLESLRNDENADQIDQQISNLQDVIILLNKNSNALQGMENYLDSVSKNMVTLQNTTQILSDQYNELDAFIGQMADNLSQMLSDLLQLTAGIDEIVNQYQQFNNGVNDYTDGVASLTVGQQQLMTGIYQLTAGSKELKNGSSDLYDGTKEVYQNIEKLSVGATTLSDGTNELNNQSQLMVNNVDSQLDDILNSMNTESTPIPSFASAKNTNVQAVQFVITTNAIEKQTEPKKEKKTVEKSDSFIDRLLALFGIE